MAVNRLGGRSPHCPGRARSPVLDVHRRLGSAWRPCRPRRRGRPEYRPRSGPNRRSGGRKGGRLGRAGRATRAGAALALYFSADTSSHLSRHPAGPPSQAARRSRPGPERRRPARKSKFSAICLLTEPAHDVEMAGWLARMGRSALDRADFDMAVQCLRRALSEPAPAAERPGILLDLAAAEAALAVSSAVARFRQAVMLGGSEPEPLARAAVRLLRALGGPLPFEREIVDVLWDVVDRLDPSLRRAAVRGRARSSSRHRRRRAQRVSVVWNSSSTGWTIDSPGDRSFGPRLPGRAEARRPPVGWCRRSRRHDRIRAGSRGPFPRRRSGPTNPVLVHGGFAAVRTLRRGRVDHAAMYRGIYP